VPIVRLCEVKLGEKLGEGSFKVVYRAVWRKQPVAVALWKGADLPQRQELEAEAQLMHRLCGRVDPQVLRVVRVLGFVAEADCVGMITEFMRGSLYEAIHGKAEAKSASGGWPRRAGTGPVAQWSFFRRLIMMENLAQAVQQLHGEGIMHLDLSSHNVLVQRAISEPGAA
jgi:serine/threonine protein kinase